MVLVDTSVWIGHFRNTNFIETHNIPGRGIGLIDVHLLASCLFKDTSLWSLDKKLKETAVLCGIETF
ncbi:MAG: hypothetical protein WAX69_24095 [Victivallales bacterium]